MRTLAVDLGERRVGLAMSDEGGRFATPMDVLNVSSSHEALAVVARIAGREGVKRIVIGLPLNMDGDMGPAARRAIEWGSALSVESPIQVVYVDERLSSFEAEQQVVDRKRQGEKITRKRKKEQLDALAAASFLQAYLDGKLKPSLVVDSGDREKSE